MLTSGFAVPPDAGSVNPAAARVVAEPYVPAEVAGWVAALLGRRAG